MRNVLGELPVFLTCIYGGLIIGAAGFVLRLPRRIIYARRKKTALWVRGVLALLDILCCAVGLAVAALTLYIANGGSVRLYALIGIAIGAAASVICLNGLVFGGAGDTNAKQIK